LRPNPQAVDEFPFPITEEVMNRGQERYNIYLRGCAMIASGTGNGRIVQRGYLKPPSYHTDRLRKMRAGHIFEIITRGDGAMPDYGTQIRQMTVGQIIAYVRALQASQNTPIDDVPADVRSKFAGGETVSAAIDLPRLQRAALMVGGLLCFFVRSMAFSGRLLSSAPIWWRSCFCSVSR